LPANPEVLVVAGPDDQLARHLHEAASSRGLRCAHLDGPSAARMFTITVDEDGARVWPDIPLFVRASAWHDDGGASSDERFLRNEAYATFWAAAALCKSPVINRPARRSSLGRLTVSAIAPRMGSPAGNGHRELYVSDPAMALERLDPPIWGEDIDFRTKEISALRPKVPARLRTVDPDACYETIAIVGTRAFAAADDQHSRRYGLMARSAEIAARFGLHFATITWMVSAATATPVRMSAEPNMAELRTCRDAVLECIWEDLRP
jgi:hypothetical protein